MHDEEGEGEREDHDDPERQARAARRNSGIRSAAGTDAAANALRAQLSSFTNPIQLQLNGFYRQPLFRFIESFERQAAFRQFKLLDTIQPTALVGFEVEATARWAEQFNSSAISGWRQNLAIASIAKSLTSSPLIRIEPAHAQLFSNLKNYSAISARLSEQIAQSYSTYTPTKILHERPAVQLRRYLRTPQLEDDIVRLAFGTRAAQSVASVTAIDALVPSAEPDEDLEAALEAEQEIVAPWISEPAASRTELIAGLQALDPEIANLILGAWEDVQRAGPAAIVKIATCAVEALERTLRLVAPDNEVAFWMKQNGYKIADGYRLTYSDRARYAFRDNKGERKLLVAQSDSAIQVIPELRSRLQASKHASAGQLPVVRLHLMNVEIILAQIVIHRSTDY